MPNDDNRPRTLSDQWVAQYARNLSCLSNLYYDRERLGGPPERPAFKRFPPKGRKPTCLANPIFAKVVDE